MSSFLFTAFPTMIKKSGGHTSVIVGDTFTEQFDVGWDDIPPNPQFNPPDNSFTEQFDLSWEDIPPNPTFDPPDDSLTEQFDSGWDGIP